MISPLDSHVTKLSQFGQTAQFNVNIKTMTTRLEVMLLHDPDLIPWDCALLPGLCKISFTN